jgi:hypothetical protein
MDDKDKVAYCGFVCFVCAGQCACKESDENGDPNCHQRDCCREKGIEGCWDCDEFPCNLGAFANDDYGGLAMGGVLCIRKVGLGRFVELARANLSPDFGVYRGRDAEEVLAILMGEGPDPGETVH